MKKPRLPLQMLKSQFIGLAILGIIILLFQTFFYWFKNQNHEKQIFAEYVEKKEKKLSKFNPNELKASDWEELGFTKKQVNVILKYKHSVGGSFSSKEQLAKCYAISSEKFAELSPYIVLPERKIKNSAPQYSIKKEFKIKEKFNPDTYTEKDWESIGFSKKQALAILKYKNYLGGSFKSKAKFRECFVISKEVYNKLSPYILLPEREEEHQKKIIEKKEKHYFVFDPNDLDKQGWQKLGFTEKQAQVILNYKEKKLKGHFRSLEDIQKCFVISEEKFTELKPWIKFQNINTEQEKVSQINDAPQIKDLNQINFKDLVAFGFTEKAAKSFLGYRKKLGGFVSKEQILETYYIDKDLAKKLIETSHLESSNITKYSLINMPEEVLKNHPYFRKYGEKIIFYRISFFSEKEIFKKIQASQEDIKKMKLYLK